GRRGTVSRHQRVSLRRAAQVDADPDTALPLTAPPARRRGGHALDRRGRRNHSGAAHGAGARQGERSTTEPPQTRHLLPHGAATQTSPRDPLHPTPPTPAPAPPLPLAPSSAIMKLSYPQAPLTGRPSSGGLARHGRRTQLAPLGCIGAPGNPVPPLPRISATP